MARVIEENIKLPIAELMLDYKIGSLKIDYCSKLKFKFSYTDEKKK